MQAADFQQSSAKSSALLERGFMALEDGEWENADGFFEEVLNQDARCAQAYLGKLLSQLQLSKASCLSDCNKTVITNNHYQKILRFGDEELINELQTHAKNNRNAMRRNAESMLRAGEWRRADKFYNMILEEDETCAAAYVGKLLAGIKVSSLEDLDSYRDTFWETNPNYAKIMKYADTDLIGRIEASIEKIKGNIKKNQAHQKIYEEVVSTTSGSAEISYLERVYGVKAEKQVKEEDLIAAAELLDTIPDYQDAAALAAKYRSKAENIRKENAYRRALHAATSPNRKMLEEAIQIFETLRDYKDAAERIDECRQNILRQEEIRKKEEYMRRGRCRYCGGEFRGLFTKTCSACGKAKDY